MDDTGSAGRALRLLSSRKRPWPSAEDDVAVSYLASLASVHSYRSASAALNGLAFYLAKTPDAGLYYPWAMLRQPKTAAIRTWLDRRVHIHWSSRAHLQPVTANRYLTTLRGVLRHAWQLGVMSADDYLAAADVRNFPVVIPSPHGRVLSVKEIRALTQRCRVDREPAGARDATILGLLLSAGLHLHEATALDLDDVELDTGQVHIRQRGGAGRRLVYVDTGTIAATTEWLRFRGHIPGPLLQPIAQTSRVKPARMSPGSIALRLTARAKQARVHGLSVRDTRRTFIAALFASGYDMTEIAAMAGLTTLASVARYDREHRKTRRADWRGLPWWAGTNPVVTGNADQASLRRRRA